MSIIRIVGTTSLLTFLCFASTAQRTAAQPSDYLVEHFTTDNGLPSNGIKGLQWDETTGFLWIATEAGVTRYNGADFVTFSRDNTPGLVSERMLFLLKDREGRIYTSDEAGDLFFVRQNRLEFMGKVTVDTRPSIFRLVGLIASGKLFRQSSLLPPANFGINIISETLVPLSEDHILFTRLDSLYDYRSGNPNPRLLSPLHPGSTLFSLAGRIYCFEPGNEFCRLDSAWHPQPVLSPFSVALSHPRLFWDNGMENPILISASRAWLLEDSAGRLTARSICTDVPPDAFLSFAKYDRSNEILFLGTNSKGVMVISKNQVRPIQRSSPYNDAGTASYSQLALSATSILNNWGDIFGPLPVQPLPIHRPFNNFILTTPDSLLWYSHDDSVYSYSYKTRQTRSIFAGAGSITDGFALSGGRLYIANAIGIGPLAGNRIDYQFRYPVADINNQVPFDMLELSPGKLAIAGCNGLFRYDTRSHRMDTMLRIPGICVRTLWKYKDFLFIGTYGRGIFLWRNDSIRPIPVDRNGYLQYAHCFIPDDLGYCWISTNKGLFRARPDDMIAAFESGSRVYYHYYGRKDGMNITELNGGCQPCALRLNDTVLSFPSMDGLVWVDPTRQLSRLPGGKIYIDDIKADSQHIETRSLVPLSLPPTTRELLFSLGFPAWADRENLHIEYRLEPYSRDWESLDLKQDARLHFSNLPSGTYRLILRKSNGFEEGNFTYTGFSFSIEPHWYQEVWSWLLGLCLFTALIIGIVRWRTRRFQIRQHRLERQIAEKTRELQAKNEELEKTDTIKTRLISIISHDLITPLRFLHLAGKNLIEKKNALTEELRQEAITEMANTSKELELLSTNILNWIKYRNEDRRLTRESFNLHELVDQLFSLFQVMAKPKQIRLINAVGPDLVLFQLIEPVRIVLYNLILNGINFTSEGYIRVSSTSSGDTVALHIEDSGVGMTPDQITNIMADHFIQSSANVDNRKGNGLGYLIIKDLMKILHGTLLIQSEKDKGSRITVSVPLA
jgi:signal transduction histidine kinase